MKVLHGDGHLSVGISKCGNDPMLQRGLDEASEALQTSRSVDSLFSEDNYDFVNSEPSLAYLRNDTQFMDLLKKAQTDKSSKEALAKDPRFFAILKARIERMQQEAGFTKDSAPPAKPKESKPAPKEPELSEEEQRILRIKNEGNEFYKKKQYSEALERYNTILEMQPNNVTVRNNVSAVLLEQGDIEGCIKYCNETVEIARSVHAKFEDVARTYLRIGNAEMKRENYEAAKEAFLSSRTESPLKGVDDKIRQCDRLIEEAKRRSYLNPEEVRFLEFHNS